MSNPLVSILICTYNAAETIESTLHSCLQQTYTHLEILIHDDQSTDDTVKVIRQIADSRVRMMISGKKLGPYAGLNFLLEHAQGTYIAIQDHDDLWHPEKIKKQIQFLEKNKEYVGSGTKTLMWYEGDSYGFLYYLGVKSSYTIHPSLVFRNGGYRYDEKIIYMNDAVFQKKMLCDSKKRIHNVDETLTLHRIKEGSKNYSYKRFAFTSKNIQTLLYLHPLRYAMCALCREMGRKLLYPVLQKLKLAHRIDTIERIPFKLQTYKIAVYTPDKLLKSGFIMKHGKRM